ncbi:MAG: hypothetical protein ACLPJH_16040 [Myxococcaceae bacterium]
MSNHPRIPVATPAIEAARIRRAALARMQQKVIDLADNARSEVLQFQAALSVIHQEIGKPGQTLTVHKGDPAEARDVEAVEMLLDHVERTTPLLRDAATAWMTALGDGEMVAMPSGLVPPAEGPAFDLWRRLVAVSVEVKVLPS